MTEYIVKTNKKDSKVYEFKNLTAAQNRQKKLGDKYRIYIRYVSSSNGFTYIKSLPRYLDD